MTFGNTEYTKEELIDIALTTAAQFYKNFRNKADDIESWEHYDNLCTALEAIRTEMNIKN